MGSEVPNGVQAISRARPVNTETYSDLCVGEYMTCGVRTSSGARLSLTAQSLFFPSASAGTDRLALLTPFTTFLIAIRQRIVLGL